MPKATIQELQDFGFKAMQFGNPADFATAATGYLARVLNDVGVFVRDQVGAAAYDAQTAGTLAEMHTRLAEKYFAAAELTARRETFKDSDARIVGADGLEAPTSRALNTAQRLEDMAWGYLARVAPGASATGSVAVGHTQSGPFPDHAT